MVCGDFVCDGDETDDMLPLRGVEVDVSQGAGVSADVSIKTNCTPYMKSAMIWLRYPDAPNNVTTSGLSNGTCIFIR